MIIAGGNDNEKKADEKKNRWDCTTNFQRNLMGAIFLLAPAANHAWYKPIFIGCMKRQHAVILESIWETDSIIIYFPA